MQRMHCLPNNSKTFVIFIELELTTFPLRFGWPLKLNNIGIWNIFNNKGMKGSLPICGNIPNSETLCSVWHIHFNRISRAAASAAKAYVQRSSENLIDTVMYTLSTDNIINGRYMRNIAPETETLQCQLLN